MRFTSSFIALVALAVPCLVSAAPAKLYGKRAAADILVLQFADVLEQLESEFYTQALAKFQDSDFTAAGFSSSQLAIEQFTVIQADESTHSTVLEAALKAIGGKPITSCKFNFDSALTDVATMAATARVVELVGVGAYLGGSTLLTDPVLLASAASIATVEARHQTILNILSGSGTAIPSAFDIPLTPNEVLALASPFFDGSCDLGIQANPSLSLTNTGSVGPGTLLTFSSSAINGSTAGFFCQMLLGGQPTSIALPLDNCVVPQGINGPVAIFITSDGQPLLNNVEDRATSQLVAGPVIAFIDTQPETLGQLVRPSGSGVSNTTTSTQTVSPAEASSIIAGSTSSGAPASPTSTSAGQQLPANGGSQSSSSSAYYSSATASPGSASSSSGGPNLTVGPSQDGTITVIGWSNV